MSELLDTFFDRDVLTMALPGIWAGLGVTAKLALAVILGGIPAGLVLAVLRSFRVRPIAFGVVLFADLFRAVPPLVVLILIYFGLPYMEVRLSGFASAWLGLTLVLAAFAEEIFWGAVLSIDRGQWEAARATGLRFRTTLQYVVLPQAMRLALPPLTNRAIAIGKATALASVIAVPEVLNQAMSAQARAANPSPLTLAAVAYVLVFFPLVLASRWIEARFTWRH